MDWNPTFLETKLAIDFEHHEFHVLNSQERLDELIQKNNRLACRLPKRVIDFLRGFYITKTYAQYHRRIARIIEGMYQGERWVLANQILLPDECDPTYLTLEWKIQKEQNKQMPFHEHFRLRGLNFSRHFDFFELICPFIPFDHFKPKEYTEETWWDDMTEEEREDYWVELEWEEAQSKKVIARAYGTKKQKRKRYKHIKNM